MFYPITVPLRRTAKELPRRSATPIFQPPFVSLAGNVVVIVVKLPVDPCRAKHHAPVDMPARNDSILCALFQDGRHFLAFLFRIISQIVHTDIRISLLEIESPLDDMNGKYENDRRTSLNGSNVQD
jgi:hypothetical protein